MISIKDLHKAFGQKKVLTGVNLQINDGETFCIIGKSGSGKSVLLKHIVGLLNPDIGSVKVDGREVRGLSKKALFELRKHFGFVFQSAALFDSYTVYENVVIGMYEHGIRDNKILSDEAKRVLEAVRLLPENDGSGEFDKEWNILSEKKPADLSGGMRKRVGVARALVGEPKYIFYDEPTTGLDPVTSEQIDGLIGDLAERMNVTSIVITHDMFSVQRIADKVAMLFDGQVTFEGTPSEMETTDNRHISEFLKRYS